MKHLAPLFALILFGCTSTYSLPHRIALLHINMTEQEVIDLLGKPRSISSTGALTIYDYYFTQPVALHNDSAPTLSYYVIIGRDHRVRSYGPN
jgi:hypothetical protein